MVFLSSSKVWAPTVLSALPFHPELGSTGRAPTLCSMICAQSCLKAQVDSCQQLLPATTPAAAASLHLRTSEWLGAWRAESPSLPAPWKAQKKAFPAEPPSCFPSRLRSVFPWSEVVPFSPTLQRPHRQSSDSGAGRRLLLVGWGAGVWDRSREGGRCAGKEREEMKGWLPPTSTPSGNILHPLSSSQHNPTLCLLPLLCHTPYPHFKMGFCLNDSASGCASLSWTSSPEHTPSSSNNIPPTRDYRAKAAQRGHLFVTSPGSVVSNCS